MSNTGNSQAAYNKGASDAAKGYECPKPAADKPSVIVQKEQQGWHDQKKKS